MKMKIKISSQTNYRPSTNEEHFGSKREEMNIRKVLTWLIIEFVQNYPVKTEFYSLRALTVFNRCVMDWFEADQKKHYSK